MLGTDRMVRLTIALTPTPPRSTHDLLEAFRFLALGTRLEPGCRGCSTWSERERVHYVEEWATEADMRRRVRSDPFTSLLTLMESADAPRVQFDFVASSRGLDYVAEVRGDEVS